MYSSVLSRNLFVPLACLVLFFASCATAGKPIDKPLIKPATDRPPVQNILTAAHISPADGIVKDNAFALIDDYLKRYARVGEASEGEMEFTELTTRELWENNDVQLFRCIVPKAEIDGLAFFKKTSFYCLIVGKAAESVLAADIDGNGKYDILFNVVIRSSTDRGDVKQIDNPRILLLHNPAREMEHRVVVVLEPDGSLNGALTVDARGTKKEVMIRPNYYLNCVDVYMKPVGQPDSFYRFMGALSYDAITNYLR